MEKKKLSLKKDVIAKLSSEDMNEVKGGNTTPKSRFTGCGSCADDCTVYCSNRTCQSVDPNVMCEETRHATC